GRASDPRDGQSDLHGLAADGHGLEGALLVPTRCHVARAAEGAAAAMRSLLDGEADMAVLVGRAEVVVAPDAEGVIQQAGGHAAAPFWFRVAQLQKEPACPRFFKPDVRFPRMNHHFYLLADCPQPEGLSKWMAG